MNSTVFGPVCWTLLQSLPRWLAPGKVRSIKPMDKDMQQSLCIIAYSIAVLLPCRYCRESYRRFIQYIDIRQWLQDVPNNGSLSPDDFEYWIYLVHNLVNQKLRRKWQRSKDQVYDGRVMLDERSFMNNLFDWLFLLFMNYETIDRTDAAALRSIGAYASRGNDAWLAAANTYEVTLGSFLEKQIFEPVYEAEFCDTRKKSTLVANLSQTRWKKSCWYIFHLANLVHWLANSPDLSPGAKRALFAVKERFVDNPQDTMYANDAAFAALHRIRCNYDPTCPSYEDEIERFMSYKASDHSRDTSSAAEMSAENKKHV